MFSGWKIGRELTRIQQQLQMLPEFFTEPRAMRRHDAAFDAGFPMREGAVELGEKVALFLLFQPTGLAESTVETCRHLVSKGYAPLVVSNTPLAETDIARLVPHVWQIMERPNFGYDFGGYKDGIRFLFAEGISPETLIILNDSVWFPVFDDEALIVDCERAGKGLAGPIVRRRADDRFLESYFLMVHRDAIEHAAFREYWQEFLPTSNKYKVIRRGERGFSRALDAQGVPLHVAYRNQRFLAALENVEPEFLRETLKYASLIDAPLEHRCASLLKATGHGWADDVRRFIGEITEGRHPYSSFPYAMVQLFGFPLLKKSGDMSSRGWRSAMYRAWTAGALPLPRGVVWEEVQAFETGDGDGRERGTL